MRQGGMGREEEYWQHYQQSKSLLKTAEHFGVSYNSVRNTLRRGKYLIQKHGRQSKEGSASPAEYWQHYQQSKSLVKTAEHFGVSHAHVSNMLRRGNYAIAKPGKHRNGERQTTTPTERRINRCRAALLSAAPNLLEMPLDQAYEAIAQFEKSWGNGATCGLHDYYDNHCKSVVGLKVKYKNYNLRISERSGTYSCEAVHIMSAQCCGRFEGASRSEVLGKARNAIDAAEERCYDIARSVIWELMGV
jgi:transposase